MGGGRRDAEKSALSLGLEWEELPEVSSGQDDDLLLPANWAHAGQGQNAPLPGARLLTNTVWKEPTVLRNPRKLHL